MTSSDWFGGCLLIVAATVLGLLFGGGIGALLGGLGAAVIAGIFVSAKERSAKARETRSATRAVMARSAARVATERGEGRQGSTAAEASLRELERLRAAGLISDEEYAAERSQIIDRL